MRDGLFVRVFFLFFFFFNSLYECREIRSTASRQHHENYEEKKKRSRRKLSKGIHIWYYCHLHLQCMHYTLIYWLMMSFIISILGHCYSVLSLSSYLISLNTSFGLFLFLFLLLSIQCLIIQFNIFFICEVHATQHLFITFLAR